MSESLISMILTVVSGVLVFTLGQLFVEFILRPIQEYKKLKAKVAKQLIMFACYYRNPADPKKAADFPLYQKASDEIRESASEVAAFAEIKPWQIFIFFEVPTKSKLLEASRYLIGVSNSFFEYAEDRAVCSDRATGNSDNAKKCMRITSDSEINRIVNKAIQKRENKNKRKKQK